MSLYLPDVEKMLPGGAQGERLKAVVAAGLPVPGIWHLFAFKPDRTDALSRFTQGVMRGPSPLPPWQRELIAALTSKRNLCPY
ncbi:MAG: peroxidase [Planctomycetes bacterium]|nr:peroxidase [Planctomycetota bacterium]